MQKKKYYIYIYIHNAKVHLPDGDSNPGRRRERSGALTHSAITSHGGELRVEIATFISCYRKLVNITIEGASGSCKWKGHYRGGIGNSIM